MPARKKINFIQSLARGLSVLQAFSAQRPTLTLTDIASITGMNLTAVQRFTDTLMELGFLGRNKYKEFFLGPAVMSLGFAFLHGSQLTTQAEVYLSEFGEKVNRTVNLAVLDGDQIVFLYRKEAQRFLKFNLHAGSKLPSYCTGSGKVLLASLDDKELRRLIDKMEMEPITSHTIVDRKLLWNDLMETRNRGYSVCDRELSLALYSLAIPLINDERKVVAAVNLSLSSEEAKGEFLEDRTRRLIDLGRTLSKSLGYEGEYPIFPHNGGTGDRK